jgi:hypothetical protein
MNLVESPQIHVPFRGCMGQFVDSCVCDVGLTLEMILR